LYGGTLGVLGLGRIGARVAAIGAAFGMHVIAWSPNLTAARAAAAGAQRVDKQALFARSDVVSVHLGLSDTTRGIVGAPELALMQPHAVLVNTARGPLLDEQALIQALKAGRIAGAALDVFEREPLTSDHPLLKMENVVLTPHLGYVTRESYRVFFEDVVENIRAFLAGSPVRVLTAPP
jgi:phosphoglycerate dehydrogenase-like enzyme